MEHLSNCHGEWNMAITALYSLPLIGLWLKTKFNKEN